MAKKDSTRQPTRQRLPEGMIWRHGAYYSQFSVRGRRVRKKLNADFRVASEMLAELKLKTYRTGVGIVNNDCLLERLFSEWQRSAAQTIEDSTAKRYRSHVRNLVRLLPVRNAAALNAELIEAYRSDRIEEGGSPGTINLEVATLVTALKWGVERKRIGNNPLPVIKRLRHEQTESRPLTLDEVDRLLRCEPSPIWHDIWYGYLATGLRKTELMRLLFTDIDWRARELIVRATQAKGQRERRIPMEDHLFAIVTTLHDDRKHRRPGGRGKRRKDPRAIRRYSADHLFVTPQDARLSDRTYDEFIRACGEADIETKTVDASGNVVEAVTLHSLRHTYATHLIASGSNPKDVQNLLGHKTLDLTMSIYAKSLTDNRRTAVAALPYGSGMKETPGVIRLQR